MAKERYAIVEVLSYYGEDKTEKTHSRYETLEEAELMAAKLEKELDHEFYVEDLEEDKSSNPYWFEYITGTCDVDAYNDYYDKDRDYAIHNCMEYLAEEE